MCIEMNISSSGRSKFIVKRFKACADVADLIKAQHVSLL
jgi:hypothetical protein